MSVLGSRGDAPPPPPLRTTFAFAAQIVGRPSCGLLVRIGGTSALALVAEVPPQIGEIGDWLQLSGPGCPVSIAEVALVLWDAELRPIAPPELPPFYMVLV